MNDYELQPIGYVRNDLRTPDDVPYNGAPSVLEVREEYAAAVAGLEPGYVWVLTWLHAGERRWAREVHGSVRGSFASRTPTRLNPVAITAARLLEIEGPRLHVDALDVCDGTPLLDVKPYVREFDCIFGPADPAWRRANAPELRLARFVRTITRFCGPLTPPLALAARLALAADRDLDIAANSPELRWECRCPLAVAGGLQAVSGAPLGGPRLLLGPDEAQVRVIRTDGPEAVYRLRPWGEDPEAMLAAPEESLFTRES